MSFVFLTQDKDAAVFARAEYTRLGSDGTRDRSRHQGEDKTSGGKMI